MHGVRRVILFCALTMVMPTMLLILPLYLRHSVYASVVYDVAESDILEIDDGISTIFCSEHTLRMNVSFNAFQVAQRPEITSYRKHIRLKKSMTLPDDTLEYWGFYLLKGASVALSVCSRFQGASILVVKGERNLRTCGMLEHNENKANASGMFLPGAERNVKVTFESNAQIVNSREAVRLREATESSKSTKSDDATERYNSTKGGANDGNVETLDRKTFEYEATYKEELKTLLETAESYVRRHIDRDEGVIEKERRRRLRHEKKKLRGLSDEMKDKEMNDSELGGTVGKRTTQGRRKRSVADEIEKTLLTRSRLSRRRQSRLGRMLEAELNSYDSEEELDEREREEGDDSGNRRYRGKRRATDHVTPLSLLDRGIKHGGNNAEKKGVDPNERSSVSSFENGLLNCYEGQVLLAREFAPSELCTNVDYLMNGKHMQTIHNVIENGYYYYIFYSDNDFVSNDIHTVFDIYKPTFQYENVTKACVNETECSFRLNLLSDDRVIVEIPTRDGIDHEGDDITLLVSTCNPRMGTYIVFPVAVLFLVLGCAFM